MTRWDATPARPVRPRAAILYLVGIAILALALTSLWLSMRAVMGLGGACATGGPFVPAVQCPDAVAVLTPVSIFGLFIGGGLASWGGASLGGSWVALIALAWPALFLSLGWNFLEFGLRPPGGEPGEVVWSWLFCAVIFGVMGGGPLLVALWGLRQARGRPGSVARGPGGERVIGMPRGRYQVTVMDRRRSAADSGAGGPDVPSRLERLARLHDAGDLTDGEFEAAKRATLDEAGA